MALIQVGEILFHLPRFIYYGESPFIVNFPIKNGDFQ